MALAADLRMPIITNINFYGSRYSTDFHIPFPINSESAQMNADLILTQIPQPTRPSFTDALNVKFFLNCESLRRSAAAF
jgi:hypothetical protein